MAYVTKGRAIYTEVESTTGTFDDPTDSANSYANPVYNGVRIRSLEATIDPQVDDENSKYLTGTYAGDESIIGAIPGTVKYSIKAAPGVFIKDTADTDNEHVLVYKDFLYGAGLNVKEIMDDTVATDAEYSYPKGYFFYPSVAAGSNTISQSVIDKNNDTGKGIRYDYVGTIGNFELTADGIGKPFTFSFDYQGGVHAVENIATTDLKKLKFNVDKVMGTVASKFLKTDIKIREVGTTTWISFCADKFSLKSGNQLANIECQSTASGIKYSTIVDAEPRITFSPEMQDLTSFDWFSALTKEKFYEVLIEVNDNYAGGKIDAGDTSDTFNPIRIYAPRCQLLKSPVVDSNGFLRNDFEFRPLINTHKSIMPDVKYRKDADGTSATYDLAGDSDIKGIEFEMVYQLYIAEEFLGSK